MKKTGIWIDHRKAIMVSLDGENCEVSEMESGAENHYHPSGGWKSGGTSVAQSVVKEQSAEERRNHQYRTFYHNIMKTLEDKCTVYIFGPAEAKIELEKEMNLTKYPHIDVSAVEACDKLSKHDIIEKVKSHFHFNSP